MPRAVYILSPGIAAEKICSETIVELTCRRCVKLSERNALHDANVVPRSIKI